MGPVINDAAQQLALYGQRLLGSTWVQLHSSIFSFSGWPRTMGFVSQQEHSVSTAGNCFESVAMSQLELQVSNSSVLSPAHQLLVIRSVLLRFQITWSVSARDHYKSLREHASMTLRLVFSSSFLNSNLVSPTFIVSSSFDNIAPSTRSLLHSSSLRSCRCQQNALRCTPHDLQCFYSGSVRPPALPAHDCVRSLHLVKVHNPYSRWSSTCDGCVQVPSLIQFHFVVVSSSGCLSPLVANPFHRSPLTSCCRWQPLFNESQHGGSPDIKLSRFSVRLQSAFAPDIRPDFQHRAGESRK